MSDLDFSTLRLPIEKDEWRDADDRMFHACFTILGQYVEDELGTEPWEISGEQSTMYRGYRLHSVGDSEPKAIDLWLWYRNELPDLEQAYADDVRECYGGPLVTKDVGNGLHEIVSFGRTKEPKFTHDFPEQMKDEKLSELIALRRCLWT